MSTCPNKNLKEWKDLVESVGEVEAYRDYLQTKGEIRSPNVVQSKIAKTKEPVIISDVKPEFLDGLNNDISNKLESMLDETHKTEADVKKIADLINNVSNDDYAASMELAEKMSEVLGIPFNLISRTDAKIITDKVGQKYDGVSSFFTNGEVYFVEGSINLDTVFHEFSHPFVRHLSKNNTKLFNSLYTRLSESEEGQTIINEVKENYDLEEGSVLFMEEVIVKSLEKSNSLAEMNSSKEFISFIKDLFYAIKKILRSSFGVKDSLKNLSTSTTIDELINILKSSDKIELDTDYVTSKDIISFNKTAREIAESLSDLNLEQVQLLLNENFAITQSLKNEKKKDEEFNEVVTDNSNKNEVNALHEILAKLNEEIGPEFLNDKENSLDGRKIALVNSIISLEKIFRTLHDDAKDLYNKSTSEENMIRIYTYNDIFSKYQDFINSLSSAVGVLNVNENTSTISHYITNLSAFVNQMEEMRNKVAMTNSVNVLTDQLLPINKKIKKKYDNMIQELKDLGADPKEVEKKHIEFYGLSFENTEKYDALKEKQKKGTITTSEISQLHNLSLKSSKGLQIDDIKIELMLRGELGDMNMFSALFEGAMTSPDIIVGGLAAYVKKSMTNYQVKVQAYSNQYADEVSRLIKNAGMNGENPGEVGEKLGFYDFVATTDEDGNIVKKKVRTLKNMFMNYRFDYRSKKKHIHDLRQEYLSEPNDEKLIELKKAEAEFNKYKYDFFNQEFKKEYYEAEQILMSTELGREAKAELDSNYEQVKQLEIALISEPKELAIQKKRLLLERSFLYTKTTIDNKEKSPKDQEKAKLLLNYKEEKSKYGKYVLEEKSFERALIEYENFISETVDVGSDEYKTLRDQWIFENTQASLTDKHRERVSNIYTELNALYAKRDKNERNKDVSGELRIQIESYLKQYRNSHGQVITSEMDEETIKIVKDLENELVKVGKEKPNPNGLTRAENQKISELYKIKRETGFLSTELNNELKYLTGKRINTDKVLSKQIALLNAELSTLNDTVANEEYVATLNELTTGIKFPKIYDSLQEVTPENSNEFLENRILINDIKDKNSEFEKWFNDNHYEVEFFNIKSGSVENKWVRYKMWDINVPKDKSSYRTYELTDNEGNHIQYIDGMPSIKYYKFKVDDIWKTKKIVGVTVDNSGRKDNWLPLQRSQNPLDYRYINKEYEDMKSKNGDDFLLLEFLLKERLIAEENAEDSDKLYYDFPRVLRAGLEELKTNELDIDGNKVNYLTIQVEKMKEFFQGSTSDSLEADLNYDASQNLKTIGDLEAIGSSIPIKGLYDIQAERVSNNITQSHLMHMASIQAKIELTKISPTVYAIKDIIEKPFKDKGENTNNGNYFLKTYSAFKDLAPSNSRFIAVDAFIKVNFEGKKTKDGINSHKVLNKIIGKSASVASWSFFAFNIPSAIKNVYGAKFQSMIEASGGEFFNHRHLQEGNMFAYGAVGDIMFGDSTLHGGAKPFSLQILDIFDATSQGGFITDLGKNITLSRTSQALDLTIATSFRKISEKQATMQIFGAMMAAKRIEVTDSDGNISSIKYLDAWEIRDNKIQLIQGVDPKHGITYDSNGKIIIGDDFAAYKNTIHQVMVKLQGNYADFDQPPAQRYIAFRAITFLRRYFIPMAYERFGYSGSILRPQARLNVGLGTSAKGTYITFGQMLVRMARNYNKKFLYMTKEEKIASKKVISELLMLFLASTMIALLGYDEDDKDKNKKLRDLSGALQIPYLTEKRKNEKDFNVQGFAHQHLILALLNIRAENKQMVALPGYGLNAYFDILGSQAIALGPFGGTIFKTIDELTGLVKGSESSFYKRDMGPYDWQQKDDAKIFNTILKPFGFTGGAIDPAAAAEKIQKYSLR